MAEQVYRILSIDAGGVRGITATVILDYIEKKTKRPSHRIFNLIAGSSFGGVFSTALCRPRSGGTSISAEEFQRTLIEFKEQIYKYKWEESHLPDHTKLPDHPLDYPYEEPNFDKEAVVLMPTPLYSEKGMESVIGHLMGETLISEALTDLLVTSYEIEYGEPFNFCRDMGKRGSLDYRMLQVALATGAMPAYIRTYTLPNPDGSRKSKHAHMRPDKKQLYLIDGGIYAVNPSLLAYSHLQEQVRETGAPNLNVLIVSLGTGSREHYPLVDHRSVHEGLPGAAWFLPVFNLLFEGMNDNIALALPQLVTRPGSPAGYYRLETELRRASGKSTDVSDSHVEKLLADAREYVEEHAKELDSLCAVLSEDKPPL